MINITDIRNVSINDSPVGALVNAFREANDPVAVQLALEGYFDGLLATHAAELASKDEALAVVVATHAAELASKDEALAVVSESWRRLEQLRVEMVAKVSAVLQSGDPERLAALAIEFLTPEQEKEKAAIRAQIAELQAKLA